MAVQQTERVTVCWTSSFRQHDPAMRDTFSVHYANVHCRSKAPGQCLVGQVLLPFPTCFCHFLEVNHIQSNESVPMIIAVSPITHIPLWLDVQLCGNNLVFLARFTLQLHSDRFKNRFIMLLKYSYASVFNTFNFMKMYE